MLFAGRYHIDDKLFPVIRFSCFREAGGKVTAGNVGNVIMWLGLKENIGQVSS